MNKEINNKCDGGICPHYRQCVLFQRKTEECKRLKYDNDYQVGALEMTIDKLKAECEELKEEQTKIKKYLGISSKTILERLEELQEFRDRDKEKLFNCERALEKVEEIANEGLYAGINYDILQIINEVKDE